MKISSAEPFLADREVLALRLNAGLLTPASAGSIMVRTDPRSALPGAASIVCAAAAYRLPEAAKQDTRMARFARLRDYHDVFGAAMRSIVELIQEYHPDALCQIFVDTGPLVERAAARRSGLGFIGKNCSLIIPEKGSFVLLGEVLTTIPLPEDVPMQKNCGDCRICLDACPTGALAAPYTLQETACLSYLTQKEGWIPREYRRYLTNTLWGCDVCQDVCPYNRGHEPPPASLWDQNQDVIILPGLVEILRWDKEQYQALMKKSALYWRGRTVLQRNALVMLGSSRDPEMTPVVAACLQDPRPVMRGHAAWALGEIRTAAARQHLEAAGSWEKDEQVQAEIKAALQD